MTSTPCPIPAAEIAAAEAELGVVFPADYVELMTRLGPGQAFDQVDVAGPQEMIAKRDFARGNYDWFVEDHPDRRYNAVNAAGDVWLAREFLELVYLAYAGPSSGFLFLHPRRPGRVYAIHWDAYDIEKPDGMIHYAGVELLDACRYLCEPFRPLLYAPG